MNTLTIVVTEMKEGRFPRLYLIEVVVQLKLAKINKPNI